MQGVSSNVVVLVAQPEFSSVLEGSPRSRFAQQKAPTSSFWVASKVGASVASDSIDVVLSSKIASTLDHDLSLQLIPRDFDRVLPIKSVGGSLIYSIVTNPLHPSTSTIESDNPISSFFSCMTLTLELPGPRTTHHTHLMSKIYLIAIMQ